MKEKFIVIGSNCFSGSSFVDYVLRDNPDAEVIGISRSAEYKDFFLPYKEIDSNRFRFYQLDLNSQIDEIMSLIRDNRPDYIINFAAQGMVAQSWQNPDQWFRTNCLAIMNLANNLVSENYLKRYVQISSPEVYGSCSGLKEEEASLRPSTPYAASKACGDLSLYPFFLNKGLPLVYTRATNVYGPYQQLFRIIPRTIIYIKKVKKIQLHGGGKAVKSYIHIRDVCDATLKIARDGRNGEVYHISPGNGGVSIYNLVQMICRKMDKNPEDCVEMVEDRFGQDAEYEIDSTKVRKELCWKPTIDLDKGVSEVIVWIEKYYNELIETPMDYIHKP